MVSDPMHLQALSEKIFNEQNNLICDNPCSLGECIYRTVINRSYYAAYNFFKNWAINDNAIAYDEEKAKRKYRGRGVHKVFIIFLKNNAKKHNSSYVIQRCVSDLESMRKDRTTADYHFDKNITKSIAKTNCILSKKIIKHMKDL